jgi:hypothetical protein
MAVAVGSVAGGGGFFPEWRRRDVVRAADDDAGVFGGAVDIIGDGAVNDDPVALVAV